MKISPKKGLLIGGGVIVAAVVIVVIVVIFGLNDIVKAAVERAGSDVTKVAVTLDEADVSPTEGKATLRGLMVGNPPGFKTDRAMSLGEIGVSLDIGSLTKDTIVIHEVIVSKPQITYELGEGGSNIETIQKNVMQRGGEKGSSGAGTSGSGAKSAQATPSDEKKLIIENLYIRNGQVRVSAVPLGGKTLDATLPDIHLTDIGKKDGGATAEQAAEQIMAALTSRIDGFVGGLDISSVLQGVTDMPAALKELAGGAVQKGAKQAIEQIQGKKGGELEGLTNSIDKVLGE